MMLPKLTEVMTPRERIFSKETYSYHIRKWLVRSIKDLEVLEYAMKRRHCRPKFEKYRSWSSAAGDQVPIDAPWHRIEMLNDLVERYGQY
jgi:hypothetical protein